MTSDLPDLDTLLAAVRTRYAELTATDDEEDIATVCRLAREYGAARREAARRPLLQALGLPDLAPPADVERGALALHAAVEALPEFRRASKDAEREPDAVPDPADCFGEDTGIAGLHPAAIPAAKALLGDESVTSFPRLNTAGDKGWALWLVGGRLDNERLATLRGMLPSLRIEWATTAESDGHQIDRAVNAVRNDRAAAAIVFTGACGHTASSRVLNACRAKGIPCVYTRTPGAGQLASALQRIEEHLGAP